MSHLRLEALEVGKSLSFATASTRLSHHCSPIFAAVSTRFSSPHHSRHHSHTSLALHHSNALVFIIRCCHNSHTHSAPLTIANTPALFSPHSHVLSFTSFFTANSECVALLFWEEMAMNGLIDASCIHSELPRRPYQNHDFPLSSFYPLTPMR